LEKSQRKSGHGAWPIGLTINALTRRKNMRHIFIGGCDRSGTTMLGAMLASGDGYIATPESNFKNRLLESPLNIFGPMDSRAVIQSISNHWRFRIWGLQLSSEFIELNETSSFADILDNLVQLYASAHGTNGATAWIDHSPDNIAYIGQLRTLYPDAKFIHLARDGRAVASSVMPLNWGPNTITTAAKWWKQRVGKGLAAEKEFPADVLRVKYEDVVLQPEAALRRICNFCGLEYSPAMVAGKGFVLPGYLTAHGLVGKPPQTDRVMGWKVALSDRQVQLFESIAGDMLIDLGYEKSVAESLTPPLGRVEELKLVVEEKLRHRLNKIFRQVRKMLIRHGFEKGD
jgi:hypothetical protein